MGENIYKQCDQQGLISKIQKQLIQLNIKTNKKSNSFKKCIEDLNRDICKEDIQMTNR